MAAPTDDEVLEAVQAIARDVAETIGWDFDRAVELASEEADNYLYPDIHWDASWPFIQRLAEAVQQDLHDQFIDTTWPSCPRHERHPLWLTERPPFIWRCTADSLQIAPLGQLTRADVGPPSPGGPYKAPWWPGRRRRRS